MPAAAAKLPPERPTPANKVRVMVVDDSAVIRGLLQRIMATEPAIEVVASASNGQSAINMLRTNDIQVVVLDIEMPIMDGLSALPQLLEIDPDLKVIVASTLTQRNAEISLKAMELGATDYLPKPTSPREIGADGSFQRELLEKIRSLGARPRLMPRRVPVPAGAAKPALRAPAPPTVKRPVVLRKANPVVPAVLAIGSSTGGPQALFTVLRSLPKPLPVPVVITQHMPRLFTSILAQHITRNCSQPCAEGVDGETLQKGRIYLAPGDRHMLIEMKAGKPTIRLSDGPAENFCRPSVDPMFRSLCAAFGSHVLAVILTGMGSDGLNGGKDLIAAGGNLVAQDEASSVVWGMPGAVATNGLCSAVLPINEIAPHISNLLPKVSP
ncbi:MAG TPA: chemotaxis response regulator protein-glutamate methylesterase [Alphaproteobacteria bacterium]|nr:chemotaxis response regulator protein-glutamate methylesterase [Alphaproteobacteria bacterium]